MSNIGIGAVQPQSTLHWLLQPLTSILFNVGLLPWKALLSPLKAIGSSRALQHVDSWRQNLKCNPSDYQFTVQFLLCYLFLHANFSQDFLFKIINHKCIYERSIILCQDLNKWKNRRRSTKSDQRTRSQDREHVIKQMINGALMGFEQKMKRSVCS